MRIALQPVVALVGLIAAHSNSVVNAAPARLEHAIQRRQEVASASPAVEKNWGMRGWKRDGDSSTPSSGPEDVEKNCGMRGWKRGDDDDENDRSASGVEQNWGMRGWKREDDDSHDDATPDVEKNWGMRGWKRDGDESVDENNNNGVEKNFGPIRGYVKRDDKDEGTAASPAADDSVEANFGPMRGFHKRIRANAVPQQEEHQEGEGGEEAPQTTTGIDGVEAKWGGGGWGRGW